MIKLIEHPAVVVGTGNTALSEAVSTGFKTAKVHIILHNFGSDVQEVDLWLTNSGVGTSNSLKILARRVTSAMVAGELRVFNLIGCVLPAGGRVVGRADVAEISARVSYVESDSGLLGHATPTLIANTNINNLFSVPGAKKTAGLHIIVCNVSANAVQFDLWITDSSDSNNTKNANRIHSRSSATALAAGGVRVFDLAGLVADGGSRIYIRASASNALAVRISRQEQ